MAFELLNMKCSILTDARNRDMSKSTVDKPDRSNSDDSEAANFSWGLGSGGKSVDNSSGLL